MICKLTIVTTSHKSEKRVNVARCKLTEKRLLSCISLQLSDIVTILIYKLKQQQTCNYTQKSNKKIKAIYLFT